MMKRVFYFFQGLAVIAASATALPTAQAQPAWFGLDVLQIAVPAQHSDCLTSVEQIRNLVFQYQTAAANSDNGESGRIYGTIDTLLFKTLGEDSVCFPYATAELTAASLFSESAIHSEKLARLGEEYGDGGNFIEKPYVANLFVKIFDAGKVEILTESARKKLQGGWTEQQNGQYVFIGGYDCATSRLFVDPHLRPMDLAIEVTHEIDHLVRDKFYSTEDLALLPPKKDGTPDWDLYNLADESDAILIGAAQQLQLQDYYDAFKLTHGSHPYQISEDFSFFKKNGIVKKLDPGPYMGVSKNDIIPQSGYIRALEIFQDLELHGILSGPPKFASGRDHDDRERLREKFFETIHGVYFEGKEETRTDYSSIFSFPHRRWKGLGDLMDQYISGFGDGRGQIGMIDAVLDSMNGKSQTCQLYSDFLLKSNVTHYLGAQAPVSNDGNPVTTHPCIRVKNGL